MIEDEVENNNDNTFIVMWCVEGLECVIPIEMDRFNIEKQEEVLAKLSDEKWDISKSYDRQIGRTLQMLTIRAQMNGQRYYEIYSIRTSANITKEDLEKYFEESPQLIVDLIREKGTKLFGSPAGKNKQVII